MLDVLGLAPLQLAGFAEAFVVGLLTPLTAACALPLYPGFVSYLARSDHAEGGGSTGAEGADESEADDSDGDPNMARASATFPSVGSADRSAYEKATERVKDASAAVPTHSSFALGLAVVAGVVTFMGAVGLVFAFFLQESLTTVVEVVSPVAFGVLFVLGIALALDLDAVDELPGLDPPETGNPYGSAFAYGLFFGGIVLPCNPGFIALFFARTPILFDTPIAGFVGFLMFGLGMGSPLLAFAAVSEASGRAITRWLAKRASFVNRVTGIVMIAVSAYYLVVVFDVPGLALDAVRGLPVDVALP